MTTQPRDPSAKAYLELLRERFGRGEQMALMEAVSVCAQSGHPMPYWLVREICAAVKKVREYEVKSWDEVLGLPKPKYNKHRDAERKQNRLMWDVWMRGDALNKTEKLSGDVLYDEVAREFGIGRNRAKKYFEDARAEVRKLLGEPEPKRSRRRKP
jgi:hypothetical protein